MMKILLVVMCLCTGFGQLYAIEALSRLVDRGAEIQQDFEAEVKKAIADGVDLNTKFGPDQKTLLLYALDSDNDSAAKALLAEGADPNVRDINGRSPLTSALEVNDEGLTKALLDSGASTRYVSPSVLNAADSKLKTMIEDRKKNRDQFAKDMGAALRAGDHEAVAKLVVQAKNNLGQGDMVRLLTLGKDIVPMMNEQGMLHKFAQDFDKDAGFGEALKAMLAAGADPNVQDSEGNSVLKTLLAAQSRCCQAGCCC